MGKKCIIELEDEPFGRNDDPDSDYPHSQESYGVRIANGVTKIGGGGENWFCGSAERRTDE